MKKLTNRLLLFLCLIALSVPALAQFKFSGEIRPRTEYLHGYKSLADTAQDPALWTEQRSRLNFDYSADKYKVGFVLQDIRVWGSQPQNNRTDGLTSIHEAWASVNFSDAFSVKLGRQEVSYDDQRIFGGVGWSSQGRSHDLAKFRYKKAKSTLDFGLAFNQDAANTKGNVYTIPNSYKTMQYLWYNNVVNENFALSLLFLNNGLQHVKTDTSGNKDYSVLFSQTAGTYLNYKKGKVKANGGGYYQLGKDGTDRDISAYQVRADFSLALSEKFRLGLGAEMLSGTSQTDTSNKDNMSFNPLYATGHKFNGYMDYFYVGNHGNSVGLTNVFATMGYTNKKWVADLDVHFFMAAADILDKKEFATSGKYTAMDANLGTELDLTLKYNYTDGVAFQAGYSQMFGTDSMVALKGGDKDEMSNWAYLMITIKPVFIK